VKLVVQYDSTTKICTGTLVNNTAHDNKAYILTAEHCVTNQFDADRTVFIFGFEDADCVEEAGHEEFALHGAYHRASMFENDFSLLEVYGKPPQEFKPYYAGWDISDQYLDAVTCVHHPQGGPKKVSVSNGAVRTSNFDDGSSRSPNAFWNVAKWDIGATEGGSSGASLFNKHGNVIGTLSGGSSECGAPYNDYFQKLSASWEASSEHNHQLKHWLDPVGSGVVSLSGSDPFEENNPIPPVPEQTTITFYPNPAKDVLIGKLPEGVKGELGLRVYDLQGRQQPVLYNLYQNNIVVTTVDLIPGIYIIKLSMLQGVYQSKFVKR
jgi:hypothetical protein